MGTRIRTSKNAWQGQVTAVVLGAILVAACSAGVGGASAPADRNGVAAGATTASASPSATPTPAPTPVEELFVERLAKLESASGSIEGSIDVGEREVPVAGSFAFQGTDRQTRMTVGSGKEAQTSETIQLSGQTYTRLGDSPWLRSPEGTASDAGAAPGPDTGSAPGPGGGDIQALLGRLDEVQPAGTVVREGRQLHRLVLPADASIDLADAGMLPAGAEDGELTLSFLAAADGRLAVMMMDASWTQLAGGQTIRPVLEIEMIFDAIPASRRLQRPDDVWVRHPAAGSGYSFALPEDWEVSETADGLALQGPGAQSIEIWSVQIEPGTTLNEWSSGSVASLREEFGEDPTANEAIMVCEIPARLLSYSASYDGVEFHGMDAAFVAGERGYDILWFSTPGSEAADRARFVQFLSLIQFPPDVHSPPAGGDA